MREMKVDAVEYIKSEEQQSPSLSPAPVTMMLPGSPGSSKNLKCNIKLLLGKYLGFHFDEFGKEYVMMTCSTTVKPKFSK